MFSRPQQRSLCNREGCAFRGKCHTWPEICNGSNNISQISIRNSGMGELVHITFNPTFSIATLSSSSSMRRSPFGLDEVRKATSIQRAQIPPGSRRTYPATDPSPLASRTAARHSSPSSLHNLCALYVHPQIHGSRMQGWFDSQNIANCKS